MTSSYAERPRDLAYMRWVRQQPCLLRHLGGCDGVVEAHHAGESPYGRKSPDRNCIPLCDKHHDDRTESRGFFRGRTRDEKMRRMEWEVGAIIRTQRRHETHQLDKSIIPF